MLAKSALIDIVKDTISQLKTGAGTRIVKKTGGGVKKKRGGAIKEYCPKCGKEFDPGHLTNHLLKDEKEWIDSFTTNNKKQYKIASEMAKAFIYNESKGQYARKKLSKEAIDAEVDRIVKEVIGNPTPISTPEKPESKLPSSPPPIPEAPKTPPPKPKPKDPPKEKKPKPKTPKPKPSPDPIDIPLAPPAPLKPVKKSDKQKLSRVNFTSILGNPVLEWKILLKSFFNEMAVKHYEEIPPDLIKEFNTLSETYGVKSDNFINALEPFFNKYRVEIGRIKHPIVSAKEFIKQIVPLRAKPKLTKPKTRKITHKELDIDIKLPKMRKTKPKTIRKSAKVPKELLVEKLTLQQEEPKLRTKKPKLIRVTPAELLL